MIITLDEKKGFTGTTTPPAPAKTVTRMPTRDIFAVANFLV